MRSLRAVSIMGATTFFLAVAGCGDAENDSPSTPAPETERSSASLSSTQEIQYDRIEAGSFNLRGPVSLCGLVHGSAGGGIYEVVGLRGVSEEIPGRPGVYEGRTYVSLELIAPWTADAPRSPVARIYGGPLFDQDVTAKWFVSLEVGETVGLLLDPPSPSNRDHYDIDELRLFESTPGGGLTNGQLFRSDPVAESDLADMVATLYDADPACPIDVQPDSVQPSTTQQSEALPTPRSGFVVGTPGSEP